MITNLLLSFLV